MELTTEELRREAERLVSLDDKGLEIEAVALALRIGQQSERAMQELEDMDREFIRMLDGRYGSADRPEEGHVEVPDAEHLGT